MNAHRSEGSPTSFYAEFGIWLVKSVLFIDLLLGIIIFWLVRSSDYGSLRVSAFDSSVQRSGVL